MMTRSRNQWHTVRPSYNCRIPLLRHRISESWAVNSKALGTQHVGFDIHKHESRPLGTRRTFDPNRGGLLKRGLKALPHVNVYGPLSVLECGNGIEMAVGIVIEVLSGVCLGFPLELGVAEGVAVVRRHCCTWQRCCGKVQ